ncbi:MAG: PAS domain S-box protein, partial [Chloroflexi bacterium]|nr:PAS domain S-box protein [Chloroflexota bacterium]
MTDKEETKPPRLKELEETRRRIAELETAVAERKQAEEALRESEERFRSVAETAIDAIISADSHGTIVYWNSAAETIFGFSAEEIVGKPLNRIIPERLRKAHLEGLERVISTGETKVIGQIVELVGLQKDGSEFPLDLTLARWKTESEQFFTAIIR